MIDAASGSFERGLSDYARTVGRRKWLLVLATVAAVSAALGVSALQEPVYEAKAEMLVLTRASDTIFDSRTQTFSDPARAVQNEIQVLEGELVATRVQDEFELESLPPDVFGNTVGSTDVVAVVVRSGDPTTARLLADAYVRAYITVKREQSVEGLVSAGAELQKKVTELQEQIDALDRQVQEVPPDEQAAAADSVASERRVLVDQQALFEQRLDQLQVDAALVTGGAQVVRTAELPDQPVAPTPLRSALLALLVGLIIGLIAAFVLDHFDDTVTAADELERITGGLITLGVVPIDAEVASGPIALDRPGDQLVESYRRLRTNVQFLGIESPVRVVHVTSPLAGEGKSTTAANLAVVFAQAGMRTLVIDADLRRPRVHQLFSIDNASGLTTVILGEPVDDVVMSISEHLDVLTSGPLPANPSEVLGSQAMRTLLVELSAAYDMIVIDSAPVLPVTDSVALSAAVDGVVLVTVAGRTSAKHIQHAVRQLQQVQAPLLGTVLNRVPRRSFLSSEGYGYGDGGYGGYGVPAVVAPPPDERVRASGRSAN